MCRQDIFYTGEIKQLEEYKSQISMATYRNSTHNLDATGSKIVLEMLDIKNTKKPGNDYVTRSTRIFRLPLVHNIDKLVCTLYSMYS